MIREIHISIYIYGNVHENFYNLRTTNSYRCRAITLVSCISHNICPPHNQHNGPTSLGTPHRQDSPSFAFRIIFSYIHHQPQTKIQIKCQRYEARSKTWVFKICFLIWIAPVDVVGKSCYMTFGSVSPQ